MPQAIAIAAPNAWAELYFLPTLRSKTEKRSPIRKMAIPQQEAIDSARHDEGQKARLLAERIAQGDVVAEGELYQHFSRGLLFFLKRQGCTPEEADDLHQETFRIVLERLREKGVDDPAALGGFVRGVALHLMRAEWRKAQRRKTDTDSEGLEREVDSRPGLMPKILERERAALVRRTIAELPVERDRQLLYRFYVAEESREDLCADLDLDAAHFHRVLYRARLRFKELYEASDLKEGPADGP